MEHSTSLEGINHSDSQEIFLLYGNRRVITVFTRARHGSPILCQMHQVDNLSFYFA